MGPCCCALRRLLCLVTSGSDSQSVQTKVRLSPMVFNTWASIALLCYTTCLAQPQGKSLADDDKLPVQHLVND